MTEGSNVRPPAVAGRFYPADPATLATAVDDALAEAVARAEADAGAAAQRDWPPPKVLVVPHAGFVYSGPVAASGYATIRSLRGVVRRVVLLGPAHFVPVTGVAVSGADALMSPLGPVPVDAEARDLLRDLPGVTVDDRAHAPEHSLEVHLPFLQRVLGDIAVLPLLVGRADPEAVAAVLEPVWGGPETLVVVSTDLSHYLPHEQATDHDRRTADAVVRGEIDALGPEDACGAAPLSGVLAAAARRGLRARLLDLRTSGDTAGPRDRVVGYGAFVLAAPPAP